MLRGGCLCGGVRFELRCAAGPFELCHCTRCRKASGTAFAAMLGVDAADYRLLQGADLVVTFEAPVVERPPGYRTAFCRRCGSPVPWPLAGEAWFEMPAGLLDDDPVLRPDRHIYVEHAAPWYEVGDTLPRFTTQEIGAFRARGRRRA